MSHLNCKFSIFLVVFLLSATRKSSQLQEERSESSFRNSSTIITRTNLREIFDFSGTRRPFTEVAVTAVPVSRKTSSTFRPTSAILYLTPPKPRHIASIESELNSIEIDQTSGLTLRWSVIVVLKPNATLGNSRHTRQIGGTSFDNSTSVLATTESSSTNSTLAKVEEERNPLKWNIYIRRYGHTHREKHIVEDRENSLDPPFTGNKSYHFRLDSLLPESSYELCIQSVNGGKLRESAELHEKYPINAQTSLAGRNNPLFICKEVVITPPPEDDLESEVEFITRKPTEKTQIKGRLSDDSGTQIEVSEEAADAFVVYTAITSGSTTVLLLIIVVTFCCCRCNKRKEEHREYRQNILYNRAPGGDAPYY